jgi:hypothetical protein
MAKSMKLGGGGRFAAFKRKVEGEGKSPKVAAAIAASAGNRKYGSKRMHEMATKSRLKKAIHKRMGKDYD